MTELTDRRYGALKIGETILAITDMRLEPKGVCLEAESYGPVVDSGWAQIFDEEGRPVSDPVLKANTGVFIDLDISPGTRYVVCIHLTYVEMRGNSTLRLRG